MPSRAPTVIKISNVPGRPFGVFSNHSRIATFAPNDAHTSRTAAAVAAAGHDSVPVTLQALGELLQGGDPTFPKKVGLSARTTGVIEHQLDAWIASRTIA
ncbi:prophage CP4-57 regulatory protein (AlpA) [Burkholderia pseudomallei]|nr:prophage CP4-57 regulatory protein (AlpA) [Burkholderia pseudomallei]CAK0188024.1 prophage CP4-57 regulatory protein (AlpA) [Burkholderia pseudomallei]CAK0482095.1 prophage CP4-57 regulatory protein (AlpA) [Burkholderia pseudomallei]